MKKIIPVLLYAFFFVWSGLLVVGLLTQYVQDRKKKEVDIAEIKRANERADSIEAEIRSLPDTLSKLERLQKEIELKKQAIEILDEVSSKYY